MNEYISPLVSRYNDANMLRVFSDKRKYLWWRKLWVVLAEEEQALGAPISDEQINELIIHQTDIDFNRVSEIEKETRHDVVAHLQHYAELCPKAKPILHLGVTSCYITDNTDVLIQNEALKEIQIKLNKLIQTLSSFIRKYASVETTAYTHFQPAQPTTIGKRACLWLQDFMSDLDELEYQRTNLKMLGCKGATGNMSGTMYLFDGDREKAKQLDENICKKFGFSPIALSSQTYSRKQDFRILQVLSGIAQSASKFATDIRLLSNLGDLREGFGETQVGSSAMPYKKNPITCERITGLARYVINLLQNAAFTAASQWLERTLDDSSNRRLTISEMFIITASILNDCIAVIEDLYVDVYTNLYHLNQHMDKFTSEFITIYAVKNGGDRQEAHKQMRERYALEDENIPNPQIPLFMKPSGSAQQDALEFLEVYEQSRQET